MRGAMTCMALAVSIMVGRSYGAAAGFAAFFALVAIIALAFDEEGGE